MADRFDFASDTAAPATSETMAALVAANTGYAAGYGDDVETTARAADLVRALLDTGAEVRFLASATAANAICLAALCRPFEAVLAHEHAHVCTNETGAPAFFGSGLGLIGLAGASGRIDPAALAAAIVEPDVSYRQAPTALSLTNATEYGTVYSEPAMRALIEPVKALGYGVHLDGARLANAIATGLDPKAIARLGVDLLVFGGAKAGMTPTEAVVIFDPTLSRRFDARLKQAGQLPSKGRFYAAPFIGMLEDGALIRHASHANAMARALAERLPFALRHPVETNAVFVDMDDTQLGRLHELGWHVYRFLDGSVRLTTSWATTLEAVEEVAEAAKSVG